MGLWDFLSTINLTSVSDKLGITNRDSSKLRYKIESLSENIKTPVHPIVTIGRETKIIQALSPLQTLKSKKPKVVNCKTIKVGEHGHAFLRHGLRARHVDAFELRYKGLLAQHGAGNLYAVVGYGDNNNWENVKYIPMTRMGHKSFTAYVPMEDEFVNIAFHDGSGNWDNNSGSNYSYIKSLLKISAMADSSNEDSTQSKRKKTQNQ